MTETTIDVAHAGSAGIMRIHGDVTSSSEPAFSAAFGEAASGGSKAVVLDFAGMDYMNSGGIGLLVTLLVRAQRAGLRLLATGLSDHYRQILALTRLDEAIAIQPDEATAVAAAGA